MASLWRRTMVYLGLQDDEEFDYDADYAYDYEDEPGDELVPERAHARAGRDNSSVRPVRDSLHEPVEPPSARDGSFGMVRPVPRDESASLVTPRPAVLNLRGLDRELQRRLIDFSSGLAYAVGGTMRKVDDQVFLLTPTAVEVSEEDKERLQARGLYRA